MHKILIAAVSAGLLCLTTLSGNAFAANDVFDLTGTTSNFQAFGPGFLNGQGLFETAYLLPLNGVTPTIVSQGDSVTVNVTLDQSYTIPPSSAETFLILNLYGSGAQEFETGSFTFYDQGNPVNTYNFSNSYGGAVGSFALLPSSPAISFDSFSDSFTLSSLNAPVSITSADFQYDLLNKVSPAPEINTWILMLLGVCSIGLLLRGSKKSVDLLRRDAVSA